MVTIKELNTLTGGLSRPSKMPGFAYGIPAQDCILGSILRKKAGSVCSQCYAFKGMYVFPNVKNAQARRMQATLSPDWVKNMTELIARKLANREKVFRWHDSGDLQSVEHLSKIVQIAKNLPDVRFWLPTRERKLIALWTLANGDFPDNLTVRVSMPMIGQKAIRNYSYVQSTVGAGNGFKCPARSQGNECKDCRACWDKNVRSVDYSQH